MLDEAFHYTVTRSTKYLIFQRIYVSNWVLGLNLGQFYTTIKLYSQRTSLNLINYQYITIEVGFKEAWQNLSRFSCIIFIWLIEPVYVTIWPINKVCKAQEIRKWQILERSDLGDFPVSNLELQRFWFLLRWLLWYFCWRLNLNLTHYTTGTGALEKHLYCVWLWPQNVTQMNSSRDFLKTRTELLFQKHDLVRQPCIESGPIRWSQERRKTSRGVETFSVGIQEYIVLPFILEMLPCLLLNSVSLEIISF